MGKIEDETSNPLIKAIRRDNEQAIKIYLKDKTIDINEIDDEGYSALQLAIMQYSSNKIIKLILSHKKIDLNLIDEYDDGTALMIAIVNKNNIKTLRLLTKHKKIDINAINNDGLNAISTAILNKAKENVIKLLLNHKKMKINQKNHCGLTPLMFALLYCKEKKIIKIFLKNKKLKFGTRSLFKDPKDFYNRASVWSKFSKEKKILKILRGNKLDFKLEDWMYETPIMIALQKNDEWIINLLIKHHMKIYKKKINYNILLLKALNYKREKSIIEFLLKKMNNKVNGDYKKLILKFALINYKNGYYGIKKYENIEIIKLLKKYIIIDKRFLPFIRKLVLKKEIEDHFVSYLVSVFPSIIENDVYGWNVLNYLEWRKKNSKIMYLLIFSR